MYKIEVEAEKKLVKVEIKGSFTTEEINSYLIEIDEILICYGKKEAKVLMALERMDPVTQDNLQLLIKGLSVEERYIKKFALVEGKVVTRMQMKRLETEANKLIQNELVVGRFNNKRDAMIFLLS